MEAATAVTTPINPNGESEPMTLAEIRSLLQHTAQTTAENARAIAEMRAAEAERSARHDEEMAAFRAAQEERAARHDKEMAQIRADAAAFRAAQEERAARHDKEMAQIRAAQEERDARRDKEMAVIQAAIAELTAGHQRNSQDISTLKGWGLEIYCERNPQIFSDALGLADAELIPKRDILRVSSIARMAGVITDDQRRNLIRADAFFYARREADHQPFCLVVEASFRVDDDDVERAAGRAEILDAIIKKYQPRNLNGDAVPIVAGIDITSGAWLRARNSNVKYVEVPNGKQLTNPPE